MTIHRRCVFLLCAMLPLVLCGCNNDDSDDNLDAVLAEDALFDEDVDE